MLVGSVDFALLLYDEFNGAAIADAGVLFRRGGSIVTPLRKREGFYVFRGLEGNEVELAIGRPHYLPMTVLIDKSRLPPGNPVESLRLRRAYPGTFADCEWLHGEGPPDADVLALAPLEARVQAGEGYDSLTILGLPAGLLLGRRFALEHAPAESFLLVETPTPGVYRANQPLAVGAGQAPGLLRAYLSQCGPNGRYHIPVEPGHSGSITGIAAERGEGIWDFAFATARS